MPTATLEVDLQKMLDEHFELPTLPTLVTKILAEIDAGSAGTNEISELIATDAGITASVLKVVNSAYYGLPCRIGRVRHAVAYLGLSEVQRLLLAVAVMNNLVPENRADFDEYWRHSFHTALSAKYVAKTFAQGHEVEEIHVCALLHDVGKLLYMKFMPEQYRAICDRADKDSVLFSQAEQELGLPSHGTLGAMLCEKWNLPRALVEVCESHELEALESAEPIPDNPSCVSIVAASNMLVNLGTTALGEELRDRISGELARLLDCSAPDLLVVLGQIYELNTQVEALMGQMHG